MRPYVWLFSVLLIGCAAQRPPLAVRSCMQRVAISHGAEPDRAELLLQSTVTCGVRDQCLDALRRRACDVGGRGVVIKSERTGGRIQPPSGAYIAVGNRGMPARSYIEIYAWITRSPIVNPE